MRNFSALLILLAASGSAFAGGFAAPIVSQISTLVPPPILIPTPDAAPPAQPTAKDIPDA
ncbi:MAG: hypothetical protein AABY68_05030 [Pseudomonadota bacterium]